MRKYKKKPEKELSKAKEEIEMLFKKAISSYKENKKLAENIIKKARRKAMKLKMPIPKELKRRICKHCNSILIPGVSVRIRTRDNHVIYFCLSCKKFMRFNYK